MWAGMRVSVLLVGLIGCRGGGGGGGGSIDAGTAAPADAGVSRLGDEAIAARFTELRDARSLRCLLDGDGYGVFEALAIDTPPAVARIAAFASFEPKRRDGDSPMLAAMGPAIHFLGSIGDLDGLRLAFDEVDRIGLPARWHGDEIAYRARLGLPIKPDEAVLARLAVIRETALAGDKATAERLYGELGYEETSSPYRQRDHVAALIALDRIDEAKRIVEAAAPAERSQLAVTWLDLAIQKKSGVVDAVTAVQAALPASDPPADLMHVLRDARRAGLAKEVAPVRRALIERLARGGREAYPTLVPELLEEAVTIGDLGERARLAALAPDPVKRWVHAMREGTLEQSIELARSRRELARVWARHVAEGADPTVEARIGQLACEGIAAALPGGAAVAPVANLTLEVAEENPSKHEECSRSDLALRLANGDSPADSRVLYGECTGACTAADKQYAAEMRAEIERRIREGWATQADLDRISDRCVFSGYRLGRTEQVAGRAVAILVDRYLAAGNIEHDRFVLAYELCGRLTFSQPFADSHGAPWRLDQLTVKASADGRELQVDAAGDTWRGVAYRVTLPPPGCAVAPVEEVTPFPY